MAALNVSICGIEFPSPIWTAAGPAAGDGPMMVRAAHGGAGGLVAKTVSLHPARVAMPNIASPLRDSLLNAELWSQIGYQRFFDVELAAAAETGVPVIASLGYSAEELAFLGAELEKRKVARAVEFSIHYTGKDPQTLRSLAEALQASLSIPVLAKLSPAVSDLPAVVRALEPVVDGFVAINSLGPALDFDLETLEPRLGSADGRGWLSGAAILPVGLHYVERMAGLTDKPIIGVGGIRRWQDAAKYLLAGAAAVQVCSLAILKGPQVYGELARGLSDWMDRRGFAAVAELSGLYRRRGAAPPLRIKGESPPLRPLVDRERCNRCLICERSCMYGAISFPDQELRLDADACVSCGLCASVCPRDALRMDTPRSQR